MKKFSLLLVTVLVAGCMLIGCGGSDDKNNDANQNVTNNQTDNTNDDANNEVTPGDGFVFTYKGTDIQIDALVEPIVTALGEADNYFESESCAFQGLDKVYTYGSVVISTYPMNEVDYVYSIELKDDTVETPEGLYIGATKADAENAYGTPDSQTDTAYVYTKGNSQLNIIFDGDVVTSIIYIPIAD